MKMRIVVTAGPTREAIDPVRFISNRSSGKMGYALAAEAVERGHSVTLVSGPVCIAPPAGARLVSVTTAGEMLEAVRRCVTGCDVLLMAAAVADWRPKRAAPCKIKKNEADLVLELEPAPDVLRGVLDLKGDRVFVGFAAETGDPLAEAGRKLREKGLDLIVANDVSAPDAGFEVDTNRVSILARDGAREDLPLMSKRDAAAAIVDRVELLHAARKGITMKRLALLFALAFGAAVSAESAEIHGWRGDGSGRFASANPPVNWTAGSNVVWKTAMPSWGNASPVIAGDRILVGAEPALLVCVSESDGAILWQATNSYFDALSPEEAEKAKVVQAEAGAVRNRIRDIERQRSEKQKQLKDKELAEKGTAGAGNELAAKEAEEKELKDSIDAANRSIGELRNELKPLEKYDMPSTHGANGYSTHTAVSDGRDVFVLRGHGMAACYSLSGERRWIRFIARSTEGWGHSASPVLVDDLFVVQMQGLTALDRKTGETVWTAPDARARWGSPIVVRIGGEAVIVTPGGDFVRARDGAMLAAKLLGLEYCAPVADGGVVYFIQKGGKAFKLPEEIGGEFKPEQLWTVSEIPGDRYYASPVVHDGLVYAINQHSHLVVIDAKTGAAVYDRKLDLGATVYPSITLVGGRLLACGENGNTAVFEPGREYREIARNSLEPFRSCPVAKGDRLYIRGMKHLYCIGAAGRHP